MPYEFRFRVHHKLVFHHFLLCEQCVGTVKNGNRCKRKVAIGLDLCFNHLESVKHLKIKKSTIPNAGKGLFAVDKSAEPNAIIFKKDQLIADYSGETINTEELEKRYGEHTAPYAMQVQKDFYTDGATQRGYGTIANHTNNANAKNCKFRFNCRVNPHRVQLVAVKNIRNGNEILTSYGRSYNNMNEEYSTVYVSNN